MRPEEWGQFTELATGLEAPLVPSGGLPTVPAPIDSRVQCHVTVSRVERTACASCRHEFVNHISPELSKGLGPCAVCRCKSFVMPREFVIVVRVLDAGVQTVLREFAQAVNASVPAARIPQLLARLAAGAAETTRLDIGVAEPDWNLLPFAMPESMA